ncbi:MAG: CBS domain-containing protein [Nitrospirae bacterium]|nr:CBS domain-containing protein [Nitrospirota bacterium]
MKVKDLLALKGREVISMELDTTVESAVRTMSNRQISAILVTNSGKPIGIFTERDVLRCYIKTAGKPFGEVLIKEAMTTDLIVAEPEEELDNIMGIMIEKNIRHLPVVEKERVIGMLSIRDVLKTQVSNMRTEIHYMKDYIAGTFISEG